MSQFKCKNTSEFKAGGNLANGFTTIPNGVMNDIPLMGSSAFTVFAKILQYINNPAHQITVKGLAKQLQVSDGKITRAITKLRELGYIERIEKKEGNLTKGYTYIVYGEPIGNTIPSRNLQNSDSESSDSENTDVINKINKNKINKKENKVVVVEANNTKTKNEEKENKLINLYKSFVLEKRVMPHTLKLLKENIHISLDVFNEIFISASDESVKKKYAYIKEIIDTLNKNNIKTLDEFNKFNMEYKESKNKYKYNKTKKDNNIYANNKNSFDNFESTFDKYTKEEFEQIVHKSQVVKYSSNKKLVQDDVQDLYDIFEK